MDFSSPLFAVRSLLRRQPALSEEVLAIADGFASVLEKRKEEEEEEGTILVSDDCICPCIELLRVEKERWEPLAVALYVSHAIFQQLSKQQSEEEEEHDKGVYMEGPRVPAFTRTTKQDNTTNSHTHSNSNSSRSKSGGMSVSDESGSENVRELMGVVRECMEEHLEHSEPRIRTLVAKLVGSYVPLAPSDASDFYESVLLPSLLREVQTGRDESNPSYSKSSTGALDDTTGWRAVETHLQAIAAYIHGGGSISVSSSDCGEETLFDICQHCCIDHVNRHVRAAAIQLLEQCILQSSQSSSQSSSQDEQLRDTVVQVLEHCLADNWSQVRMAASVLCRQFLLSYADVLSEDSPANHKVWRVLLPRMCLNRFYLAQGVKLYSLETWKLVFPTNGLAMVAKHAGAVCKYYIQGCDADNHVVREAACQAVAELAHKIGQHPIHSPSLTPYITMLLQALIMCFHDESWPVRDEACLACGSFCMAYPKEAHSELPTLMERWTEHLTDPIWSVREDAAMALGDAIRAYGQPMADQVWTLIQANMPSAKDQPPMTMEEYTRRQNDINAHTDSQLYSCGSLAPKLKKKAGAGRIGGCSSCAVNRPKQPWEATDGAIYLLREYISVISSNTTTKTTDTTIQDVDDQTVLLPMVEQMMDVCRVQHFPQGDDLRQTLWRCWPTMASALGKQRFKRYYLELILDPIMNNAKQGSALSMHAAKQCIVELANLVGIPIFRNRMEDYQHRQLFDQILHEQQQQQQHDHTHPAAAAPMDMFSPFGPPLQSTTVIPPTPITPPTTTTKMQQPSTFSTLPNIPGNQMTETL